MVCLCVCVCVCDSLTALGDSMSVTGANGSKEGFCVAAMDRDGIFKICSQTFRRLTARAMVAR